MFRPPRALWREGRGTLASDIYPGEQAKLVEVLGDFDHGVRNRVLERNAVELYNLPPETYVSCA